MSVLLARAGMPGQGRLFAAEGEVVMRRGWKTGYAVLLSVLLGLGGVGCTTQSSVSSPTTPVVVTPSTSTTSVTASSATPTATNDDEAAKSAGMSYFEAFNKALITLDPTPLRSVIVQGCQVCEQDIDKFNAFRSAGRKLDGGTARYSGVRVESRPGANEVIVVGQLDVAGLRILDGTGQVVETYPPSQVTQRLWLTRRDGAWRVQSVFS